VEAQPPREPKAKIFVIDDSPTGLTMAREILEDAGYLVHTFKSPIGITRALHHLRPDLIVLDVNMPAISGDKICRLIRGISGSLNPLIILYSSISDGELRKLASECGADGFVSKGGYTRDLLKTIRDSLFAKASGSGQFKVRS